MVHAFVMVETATGAAESVVEAALDRDAVSEAHVVAGEYDVIAEVTGDSVDTVLRSAAALRSVDDVRDSTTYVAMAD
ncbi:MAG: transcriptional regulator [uncultured archaeon A07HB70]|nr:MAG: transcriptional regulator [uncultured archaeon A07HB70]